METMRISEENAGHLKNLLELLNHSRSHLIQEGSLRIETTTLEWRKDVIRITVKEDFIDILEKEALDHESDN